MKLCSMNLTRNKVIFLAMVMLATVGIVVCTVLVGVNAESTHKNVKVLLDTNHLSSELRQSSDDLTRFIRTFTVTANASYWMYFQDVIAIRNGLLPLPLEPERNYWDLLISDGVPPRGFSAPSPLVARMRQAQFTASELELLNEAHRQSDALIDLENVAYNAMIGRYRVDAWSEFSIVGAPNQTLAMGLVHGSKYHHWKGKIMRPIDQFAQQASKRVSDAIDQGHTYSVIVISVLGVMCGILLSLVLVFFFIEAEHNDDLASFMSDVRDVKNAPKGGNVAIVFTDIEKSTALWGDVPQEMSESLSLHHKEIRRLIVENKAYEVKTIGDSFMIAMLSPSDAVRFSLQLQERLHSLAWNPKINSMYDDFHKGGKYEQPLQKFPNAPVWNGLRVRIGICYGPCEVHYDEVSKGYDYYGPVVNMAARIEAAGHGGQVLLPRSMWDKVDMVGETASVTLLGEEDLRGVGMVDIVQVLPPSLAKRTFAKLRTERDGSSLDNSSKRSGGENTEERDDDMKQMMSVLTAPVSASKNSSKKTIAAQLIVMQLGIEKLFAPVPTSQRGKVIGPILASWGVYLPSGGDDDMATAIGIVCGKVWPVVRSLLIEREPMAPQAVVASDAVSHVEKEEKEEV